MAIQVTRSNALLGLLATIALGCSDGGGGAGSLPAAQFVAAAAVAECDDFGDCCAQDQHPFDAQRCRANVTTVLQARVDNAAILYDAEAAAHCVAALRASPGQCATTPDEFESCLAVFRGSKPIGAPCAEPQECAGYAEDDVFCWPTPESEQPVCAQANRPLEPVGEGDACGWTCDQGCTSFGSSASGACLISDGLYCANATSTCTPLVAEGGSCAGESLACSSGTFCDGERCARLRADGESCPSSASCAGGLFCDDGLCAPLRGEGESCALRYGGCGDVAPCTYADPTACQTGLACSTSDGLPVCRAPQPDGAACASFQECSSGWCERGTCAGDACEPVGVCGPPRRTSPEFCAGDFEDASDAQSLPPSGARATMTKDGPAVRLLPWQRAHRLP